MQRGVRRPISCSSCRSRKLKCDRALPGCGNCVNRGEITACRYASQKAKQPSRSPETECSSEGARKVARIDHLEKLVHSLLAERKSTPHQIGTQSTRIDLVHDLDGDDGRLELTDAPSRSGKHTDASLSKQQKPWGIRPDQQERSSVNEAQWGLLLNKIGAVQPHVHSRQQHYEDEARRINLFSHNAVESGPLLFGSTRSLTHAELLTHLPSKHSCDTMITRFFAHLYPGLHFLHRPSFQKQYELFWRNQSELPSAWIAQLFAILRIAMLDYIREGDEPLEYKGKCRDFANIFRSCLTDCLVVANYTRPQDFIIEALGLHLYGEYVSSRDARSSVWVLSGMVVRLAMQMGYHQQSQPGLSTSSFHVELRRRTWLYLRQADIMISFQMGFPSMVKTPSSSESLPRNVYDDHSFVEDCTTLPPALPDCEPTPIAFLIAKAKLVFSFARVLDELSKIERMDRDSVLALDRELRQVYEKVPEHYKLGQLSVQDPLMLVSARFALAGIHHKSLCVLHSGYQALPPTGNLFSYSKRVCLSSAMSILRFQAIQNQHIPVDGRMRSLTSYQTSLTIHDYLLSTAIIAAELCFKHDTNAASTPRLFQGQPNAPTKAELKSALELSTQIFVQMRNQSLEAYKAADILGMLMRKLNTEKPSGTGVRPPTTYGAQAHSNTNASSASSEEQTDSTGATSSMPEAEVYVSQKMSFEDSNNAPFNQNMPSTSRSAFMSSSSTDDMLSHTAGSDNSWIKYLGASPTFQGSSLTNQTWKPAALTDWLSPDYPSTTQWSMPPDADVFATPAVHDQSYQSYQIGSTNPQYAAQAVQNPMSVLWNFSV